MHAEEVALLAGFLIGPRNARLDDLKRIEFISEYIDVAEAIITEARRREDERDNDPTTYKLEYPDGR